MTKHFITKAGKTIDLANAKWHKSTRSGHQGECVEVAFVDGLTVVRDTKDREGPVLAFTKDEWRAFVGGVKDGEFDFR